MNFEAERWIVGAQAVGQVGVARRIDVIARAMMDGATVFDLEDLELCYAPQFGAAKTRSMWPTWWPAIICAATCPWRIGVNWRKPRPY